MSHVVGVFEFHRELVHDWDSAYSNEMLHTTLKCLLFLFHDRYVQDYVAGFRIKSIRPIFTSGSVVAYAYSPRSNVVHGPHEIGDKSWRKYNKTLDKKCQRILRQKYTS